MDSGMERLLQSSVNGKKEEDGNRRLRFLVRSQERLSNSIEKKLKTTFIGALSVFEEAFGDLWGYRLPERELTDEQFDNRKKWEFARTKILNNGNTQLRTSLKEISEYDIEWKRHHSEFVNSKVTEETI